MTEGERLSRGVSVLAATALLLALMLLYSLFPHASLELAAWIGGALYFVFLAVHGSTEPPSRVWTLVCSDLKSCILRIQDDALGLTLDEFDARSVTVTYLQVSIPVLFRKIKFVVFCIRLPDGRVAQLGPFEQGLAETRMRRLLNVATRGYP